MTYVRNGEAKGAVHPNIGDDLAADGLAGYGTAGEKVSFGETGYMSSNGRYYKALADSDETMPVEVMFVSPANAGKEVVILKQGWVRNDAWNFIVKGNSLNKLYASGTTAGAITMRPPTDYRQVIGSIVDRNVIFFSPEPDINYGSNTRQTIKDLETDINALFERQTYTLQYLVVAPGEYIISEVGRHGRIQIKMAYAKLADNIDSDQVIQLFIGDKAISEPLTLKSTESAGKAQLIDIGLMDDLITSRDDIRVKAETDRRTEIVLLVQSYEGE